MDKQREKDFEEMDKLKTQRNIWGKYREANREKDWEKWINEERKIGRIDREIKKDNYWER